MAFFGTLQPRHYLFLFCALLAVETAVFWPSFHAEFVNLDDGLHLYDNPAIRSPTWAGLRELWAEPYKGLYVPVTYTLWKLVALIAHDAAAPAHWGHLSPVPFHCLNFALHYANTCFVFLLLLLLLGRFLPSEKTWRSALVGALLFGLHPLQTEAAVWVSALKDLLSTFFSLLALLFYFDYQQRVVSDRRYFPSYCAALSAFGLGLLAKPSIAVLPLILLVLGRTLGLLRGKRVAIALVPFFVLPLPVLTLTKLLQPDVRLPFVASFWQRPLLALDSVAFYLSKFFFPVGLVPDYARTPQAVLESTWAYLVWVPCLALVYLIRRRHAFFQTGATVFLIALAPILGLVSFFFQFFSGVADRYLYFPFIGMALCAAWGYSALQARFSPLARSAVTTLLLLSLGLLTHRQAQRWNDTVTLFEHTIRYSPKSLIAHTNLAALLEARGEKIEALTHYLFTTEFENNAIIGHYNAGRLMASLGMLDKAVPLLTRAVLFVPQLHDPQYALGLVHLELGNLQKAKHHLTNSLRIDPKAPKAHYHLSRLHLVERDYDAALESLRKAELFAGPDPDFSVAPLRAILAQKRPKLTAVSTR